jgi:hypothetical protein
MRNGRLFSDASISALVRDVKNTLGMLDGS